MTGQGRCTYLSHLIASFVLIKSQKLSMMQARKNRLVSIHHNIHGNKRLGEIGYALQHANDNFQKSEENYKRLADRVITMDEAREAIFRTMEPLKLEGQETGLVQKTWERRATQFIDRFTDADNGGT